MIKSKNSPLTVIKIENTSLFGLNLSHSNITSRFGSVRDGGYILTDEIVLMSKFLISGGVGMNVEFEDDISQLNRDVKIILIDGSVSKIKFKLRPLKYLFSPLFYNYCSNTFRFLDVLRRSYFEKVFLSPNKNITHFIEKYELTNFKGILKLDIEGSEWELLEDILYNLRFFNALCIEFHSLSKNLDKFNAFSKSLTEYGFKVLSYSINNSESFIVNEECPNIIEVTFAEEKFFNSKEIFQRRSNDNSNLIFNF